MATVITVTAERDSDVRQRLRTATAAEPSLLRDIDRAKVALHSAVANRPA